MKSFRQGITPVRLVVLFVVIGLLAIADRIEPSIMIPVDSISTTSTMPFSVNSVRPSEQPLAEKTLDAPTVPQLPDWLQILDLNEAQIRQVFEIDSLLEQRLQMILNSEQYSQWQSSQINLSDAAGNGTWTFEDIDIDLSPYQQTAVNAVFRDSLQSVLAMLSVEQSRLLQQYLSEEQVLPGASLDI